MRPDARDPKQQELVALQTALAQLRNAVAQEHVNLGVIALDGICGILEQAARGDAQARQLAGRLFLALDQARLRLKIVLPADAALPH